MIFSSLQYLIFLPIVVFAYWRTRGGARIALIVLASYFFYMSWLPIYGAFLLALTLANWALGLWIAKVRSKYIFWLGLALNLGCLCYYKYTNFFFTNLFQSLDFVRALGLFKVPAWEAPILNVALPLGISFFIFEFIHYLADVYRGNKPIKSLMEFSVFASFFPSQIAGPIKRYQDFLEKLRQPEPWSTTLFFEGCALIMQGLFKKIAIADQIGTLVYAPFSQAIPLSTADVSIAAFAFYIQLYCDFSGYTDIGRGSALLLGIRLPINFNLPYLALNITEFWRRWHISLSSWLRDYVYIPLGGSRGSTLACIRNTMITFLLCGLWHGASWHFVVFGGFHGIGLVINKEWNSLLERLPSFQLATGGRVGQWLAWLTTQIFVVVGFAIFRVPDMGQLTTMLGSLANVNGHCYLLGAIEKLGILQIAAVYMLAWMLTEYMTRKPESFRWLRDGAQVPPLHFATPVRLAAWTAACCLMFAVKPTTDVPFVYFQF